MDNPNYEITNHKLINDNSQITKVSHLMLITI